MARAPCDSEMAPYVGKRGQSVENFCQSWQLAGMGVDFVSVGVLTLSETMHTLWRETSSCTSLRAVHTAFSSAWLDEHHLPAGIVR